MKISKRRRMFFAAATTLTAIGAINAFAGSVPSASAAGAPKAKVRSTPTVVSGKTLPKITVITIRQPCWYLPNGDCVSWEEYQQWSADHWNDMINGGH